MFSQHMPDDSQTANPRNAAYEDPKKCNAINDPCDGVGVRSPAAGDRTIRENRKCINDTKARDSQHQQRVYPTEDLSSGTCIFPASCYGQDRVDHSENTPEPIAGWQLPPNRELVAKED